MPATVAIVGRPNVGKSTLFNRLLRRSAAITHDRAGVTRDRLASLARLEDREVLFIDTGGLEMEGGDEIDQGIMAQAREAVTEAQAILLVVDGREGLTGLDERVAEHIRSSGKPTLIAVNKVDGPEKEAELTAEFHALGFELAPVSAAHGYGMRDLRFRLVNELLADIPGEKEPEYEQGLRLAMLGRPNAGKSSLINRLVGADRLLVSDQAGTTRDAVDATLVRGEKRYTFVDTAGVRRRAKVTDSLERFSVMRALKSAARANVSVLVLDAGQSFSQQDKKLLAYLEKEKVPLIMAVNKTDLVPKKERKRFERAVREELRIASHVPVVFTSALSGEGVDRILPMAEKIMEETRIRISTGKLNRVMHEVLTRHQPPQVKYRRAKFYYLTQTETEPPTFVFFVNQPSLVKESYKRYVENQLRKQFNIPHAPMRIHYRASRDSQQKWG
ncbi:ribosome biogenesis GTPase Der [Desulfohalovibrio reitneri]|uniref:ribosome biogenesis GTPase Der n=1 Tax=Desulfohalovibrio reitneri TaxID=1307759 RepID=UPI0004A745D4|nr:ribosome biogenesis GTPase Der [Desulfohalovibrio reitneri]